MINRRTLIRFIIFFVLIFFAICIFYSKKSFFDELVSRFNQGGEEKISIVSNQEVRGDYDENCTTSGESVVDKYSFPVASYTPVRKPQTPDLSVWRAHSSVILDAESGTILHYQNGKEERQIASLTKIMTAVLVVENIADLENKEVVIDEDAVYADGTKIGCPSSGNCIGNRLRIGEKISAMSLLKAMLMNSANDSAIALAKHVGGTEEKFAQMMNDKAKELGLKNTNFCTASGLEIEGKEEGCYSSAYDIARIAAFSMKYKVIWETFKIHDTKVYSMDGSISHDIMNTNRLLDEMPECLGTKTGFTPLAGKSLMMAAEDKTRKHKIIAVVLNDPYMWEDIREMAHWAFESYIWQ